jgi:glucosamine-6-phosphate deaminase
MMDVQIYNDLDALKSSAAQEIAKQIQENPSTRLGLPTGGTPVLVYQELIRLHREENLDFQNITTFNLDEYIGLTPDHPCSYRYFMEDNLFRHINIPQNQIHIPNGMAENPMEECASYERALAQGGGLDLQVLGIGQNGHIGFNEPGTPFHSLTHVVDLTPSTRKANARFFESEDLVPHKAISMGIKTIMQARRILLLAIGESKSEILYKALYGPITPEVPASVLQRHPNLIVMADRDAGKDILKNTNEEVR